MSSGNFTYFYRFCARQMGLKNSNKKIFYLLRTVKSARNGVAHDSLFLNGLREINPSVEKRDELLDLIKLISRSQFLQNIQRLKSYYLQTRSIKIRKYVKLLPAFMSTKS